METLCGITDWQTTTATRGRGKGNQITSRYVVAADKWNWIVGLEREGYQVVGQKFGLRMSHLIPSVERIQPGMGVEAASRIIDTLSQLTGRTLHLNGETDLKAIGAKIDEVFGTNLFKDRTHLKKFFGTDESVNDDE